MTTALRISIRFIADHAAVLAAIAAGDEAKAFEAMRKLIDDVLELIERSEPASAGG